jgi:hypothetical protein
VVRDEELRRVAGRVVPVALYDDLLA